MEQRAGQWFAIVRVHCLMSLNVRYQRISFADNNGADGASIVLDAAGTQIYSRPLRAHL